MRYLLMIYGSEDVPDPTPEEQGAVMAAYNAFGEYVRSKDAFLGGEALEPTATATTVRVRDGQTLTTDGPFAETKEQLGGQAADPDEERDVGDERQERLFPQLCKFCERWHDTGL